MKIGLEFFQNFQLCKYKAWNYQLYLGSKKTQVHENVQEELRYMSIAKEFGSSYLVMATLTEDHVTLFATQQNFLFCSFTKRLC